MKIMITGATGFVGRNLIKRIYKKKGWNILCLVRKKPDLDNLNNIKSKLKIFNIISLLIFKLIGFRNYLLILKLFKPFSRTESQLHLIDKVFIDNNIY